MAVQKVLVTGAAGMLGGAVSAALKSFSEYEVVETTKDECDLLDSSAVNSFFTQLKPDFVFHCAARVGGIGANKAYPVEFLLENLTIQNNVFSAAHNNEVKRLIFFASNAVYPQGIDRPIEETDILSGTPEETVRPYALAKLSGIELCHSFNKQYGTKYLSLIPVNLYGPGDNFDPESSHVLPALIRKFHNAKVNNDSSVEIWGSGKQRREFMCCLDLARVALEVMRFDDSKFSTACNTYPPLINVGVGEDISIRELAELISEEVGFKGELKYDTSKPEGISKKQTSIARMKGYGLQHEISLKEGISLAYKYFLDTYKNK